LGGIKIPFALGLKGHSDADPVIHALIDALLGACGLGDIGKLFSDKNKKYKNIRSTILLKKVIDLINSKNFSINNIDINIITEKPRIKKYTKKMIDKISKICQINPNQVNIKGKTTEKLGLIGKEKAIASEMIKKFNLLFLTLFNIGKIKNAPGTAASLITCLLFLLLINIFNISIIFLFTLAIFAYSFVAINNSFDEFSSSDPQEIVIDEFVGQMLPLLAIPIYETLYLLPKMYYCIPAFLLFRLFDIWKPYPVSYVDKNVNGAIGIMLDDIFAGIYTIISLVIIFFFLGA